MRHGVRETVRRLGRRLTGATVVIGATVSGACSSADSNPGAATTMTVVGGNAQSGPVSSELQLDLLIKVTDASGTPVSGVKVMYTATGGALLALDTATTNSSGISQNVLTLGPAAGTDSVIVTAPGIAGSLILTEQATAATPTNITMVSGNNQTGPRGATLPAPLVVLVRDRFGNPVENAMVDWSTTFGVVGSLASLSDSTGKAQTTWTLPAAAGVDTAIAVLNGTGSIILFTATGN